VDLVDQLASIRETLAVGRVPAGRSGR
jgi:hypothetical protein